MYVYSLCVYIDGYVCIVYALWSIFIGERAQQASLPSHLNCVTVIQEINAWLK